MVEGIENAVVELSSKAINTRSPADAIRYTEAICNLTKAYLDVSAVEIALAEAGLEWNDSEKKVCEVAK
jgi:hypothetical protein